MDEYPACNEHILLLLTVFSWISCRHQGVAIAAFWKRFIMFGDALQFVHSPRTFKLLNTHSSDILWSKELGKLK